MKESFVFYKSWMEALTDVPDDIRLEVYDCIIEYAFSGKVPSLKPMAKMAFNFIKTDIDRANEKYNKIVDRNRDNGKKGGRPKNPNNPVGFNETQRNPNDNDNDNDNEDVYDNENDVLLKKETKEENFSDQSFSKTDPVKKEEEISSKKVAQKKVSKTSQENLVMPEDFEPLWKEWNEYRKDKRIKAYAGVKWEQMAVDKLLELSNRDPETARLILKNSYENNYQGFFPLKDQNNGKPTYNNSNNGNNNRTGNSSMGKGGKKSASSILAERARREAAGNSDGGDITVEAEVVNT